MPRDCALSTADWFAPANWKSLDDADLDLGGTGPLLVHVAPATPSDLAVARGKNGRAWLLDRGALGGIGGELASANASNGAIITAAAACDAPGGTTVVFRGAGVSGRAAPARWPPSASPPARLRRRDRRGRLQGRRRSRRHEHHPAFPVAHRRARPHLRRRQRPHLRLPLIRNPDRRTTG